MRLCRVAIKASFLLSRSRFIRTRDCAPREAESCKYRANDNIPEEDRYCRLMTRRLRRPPCETQRESRDASKLLPHCRSKCVVLVEFLSTFPIVLGHLIIRLNESSYDRDTS